MNGLMMHCGAESIPREQLNQIFIPKPTDTHFPVAHHDFLALAESKLEDQGYMIQNQKHFINHEGAQYFAMMELIHEDEYVDDVRVQNGKGYSTLAALRNTHDKTFAASIAIGARVFVCDNLSFSGDIVVGRKHTKNIMDELPGKLEEAISRIRVMRKRQDIRFDEYKLAPLSDREADHLIMETFRQGIINLKRIGKVNQEWYEPTNDHGDKTVWRYFNAVTAGLGADSINQLIRLPKKTIDLHLLLDDYVDVDLPSEDQLAEVEPEDRLSIGATVKGALARILN